MATMQEAMAAAFDKHSAELEEPDNTPAAGAEEQHGQEAPETPELPADKPAATEGRVRDPATGKFLPKEPKDEVPEDQQQVQKEKEPVEGAPKPAAPAPVAQAPAQPALKAPVSWRPEVRGKFGSLPPDIQAEVARREHEIDVGLREASVHKRFTQEFSAIVQPYAAMLQAEGASNPLEAVKSFFNTAYLLRTAPPQQKAQLVANMISQFGVDIEMLDNVLAGQASPQKTDPTVGFLQQELAPIKQFMQTMQTQMQTAQQSQKSAVQQEIEAFASKAEFWEDVAPDVADILEMAAKRGQKLSLQDAYNRATMLHPTISGVLASRKVEQTAAQRSAAASRSRDASASLPSGGAPEQSGGTQAPKGNAKDLSSAISAAWDAVESRANE